MRMFFFLCYLENQSARQDVLLFLSTLIGWEKEREIENFNSQVYNLFN